MKRVSIIALALALLLCGCGSAPAQPVSAAAPPTHEADAAVSPEIIEDEPEVYDSARDFLRSLYDECGNFYFSNNAAPDCLDWLAQQPQDQPVKFVVYGWPFSNSDKRLDKWNIPLQNHDRALMALSEVLGDDALTEYESVDALRKTLDDEQLLKKLPEEYSDWVQDAEGWEEAIDTYESEYLPLSEELDLEYALRDAEAFAAQGVQAEVMAAKIIDNGRDSWAYTCIVTAAPDELLGLSNKMDGLYHIWIPGEQFLLRFNIHIWPEE